MCSVLGWGVVLLSDCVLHDVIAMWLCTHVQCSGVHVFGFGCSHPSRVTSSVWLSTLIYSPPGDPTIVYIVYCAHNIIHSQDHSTDHHQHLIQMKTEKLPGTTTTWPSTYNAVEIVTQFDCRFLPQTKSVHVFCWSLPLFHIKPLYSNIHTYQATILRIWARLSWMGTGATTSRHMYRCMCWNKPI